MDENLFDSTTGFQNNSFQFDPIENLLSQPSSLNQVDSTVIENLREHGDLLNSYFQHDPSENETGSFINDKGEVDLSSEEAKRSFLQTPFFETGIEEKIVDPISFGIKESNFDRYYAKGAFDTLGFHPYIDNETMYNTQSSIFSDVRAGLYQTFRLGITGFTSSYETIGALFNSEDYFGGKDLDSAVEFADAMRIGNSSRGGVLGFGNNLFLQLGYTAGIAASVVAEEAVLFGLTALTGGGTAPIAGARTGFNLGRLVKAFGKHTKTVLTNSFDITRGLKASRDLLRQLNNVDKAKDFWSYTKGAGTALGGFFAPETIAAIKEINSVRNTARQLSNMAVASKTFGSFYRDLRAMNLALAEARMEAGMLYNSQIGELIALEEIANPDQDLTDEQLENIRLNAEKAAVTSSIANTALIYMSNKIVLSNILGGYNRNLAKFLTKADSNILNTAKAGAKVSNPYKYFGRGLKNRIAKIKAAGVSGNSSAVAGTILRYFAANFAEGAQEIGQEAIAVASQDYWLSVYEDPTVAGFDTIKAATAKGLEEQFSAQGAETFLSGFLMGGAMSSITSPFKYTLGDRVAAKLKAKTYKEYVEEQDKLIQAKVDLYNKVWNAQSNNINGFFDTQKLNYTVQKQVAEAQVDGVATNDLFSIIDNKDVAKFTEFINVIESNKMDDYLKMYKDYLNLSDQELVELFPQSSSDSKKGKIRERLEKAVKDMESLQETYNNSKNKFLNPFAPGNYKPGTRERREESLKYAAYEHARRLAIFTKYDFTRAAERINSIYEELSAEPLFENMQASDISILLTEETLQTELDFLQQEISTFSGLNEKSEDQKKIISKKIKRQNALSKIKDILYSEKILTKKGVINKTEKKKLLKAFGEYVNEIAGIDNKLVFSEKIENAFDKIVDYRKLKDRSVLYNNTLTILTNPQSLSDLSDRIYAIYSSMYEESMKTFQTSIDKYVDSIEFNTLLNELRKIGVYVLEDDLEKLKEGNINISLYDKNGEFKLFPDVNKDPNYIVEGPKEAHRLVMNYIVSNFAKKIEEENKKNSEETEETEETEEKGTTETSGSTKTQPGQTSSSQPSAGTSTGTPKPKQNSIQDKIQKLLEDNNITSPEPILSDPKAASFYTAIINQLIQKIKAEQIESKHKPLSNAEILKTKQVLDFIEAYKALRKIWYTTIEESDIIKKNVIYNNETDFETWLDSDFNRNNVAQKVLEITGTLPEDFKLDYIEEDFTKDLEEEGEAVDNNGPSNVKSVRSKTQIVVLPVNVTGLSFKVTDLKGNDLSDSLLKMFNRTDAIFKTLKQAQEFQELIENYKPQTAKPFAGLNLDKGVELVDKNNNEFVVISSNDEITKNNKVKVYNRKTQKNQFFTLQQFTDRGFKIKKVSLQALSENVSKLKIDDATALYSAYVLPGVSRVEKENELSLIFANLSEEDLKELSIEVKKLTDKSTEEKSLQKGGKDPNEYVKNTSRLFDIVLKITNPDTIKRVNDSLKDKGYPELDPSGAIAYMPSSYPNFYDANGRINVMDMTVDQAENIFNLSKNNKEKDLEYIKENYLIFNVTINAINDLLNGKSEGTFSVKDLEQKGVYLDSYTRPNRGPEVLASSLKYNNIDGVFVIAETQDRTSEEDAPVIVSNYIFSEDASPADKKRIRKEIEDFYAKNRNNLEFVKSLQGYVAFFKRPDGRIHAMPLKTRTITKEEAQALSIELANQRMDNEKNNKDPKTGDPLNLSYNTPFNIEFNKKVFFTAPDGYEVQLLVGFKDDLKFKISYGKGQNKKVHTQTVYLADIVELAESENISQLEASLFILTNEFKTEKEKLEKENAELKKKKKKVKPIPALYNLTFGLKNLRTSFDKKETAENIMANAVTTVSDNYYSSVRLKAEGSVLAEQEVILNSVKEVVPTPDTITPSDEFKQTPTDKPSDVPNSENLTDVDVNDESLEIINTLDNSALDQLIKNKAAKKKALEDNIFNTVADPEEALLKSVEDPEIVQLSKDLEILNGIQSDRAGNKIVSTNLEPYQIEDINKFKEWVKQNLPDSISVDELDNLGNNLINGNMRVGAFMLMVSKIANGVAVNGTIYTSKQSPYKYHEAFHAVFRMLLTEEEQLRLLKTARKELKEKLRAEGKNYNKELELFKSLSEEYENLSEEKLERLFVEEYMADEFDKFKMNPKSTNTDFSIKNIFNRFINWIKTLLNLYHKNELLELFENIDSGKYKSYQTMEKNLFIDPRTTQVSIANAFIPYDSIQTDKSFGYKTLEQEFARNIIRAITADVLLKKINFSKKSLQERKGEVFNINKQIDLSIATYNRNYNLSSNKALAAAIAGNPELIRKYRDLRKAFDKFQSFIKKEVINVIESYEIKTENENDEVDDITDVVGDRGLEQYGVDASMIGGEKSLSTFLRTYIGTTILKQKDEFGLEVTYNGTPAFTVVDTSYVYNGLMKALSNETDLVRKLQKMYIFGESGNEHTKAFVRRFFADVNVTWETKDGIPGLKEGHIGEIKNPMLLQKVTKGFEKFKNEHLFIHDSLADGFTAIYSAANRDDSAHQVNKWADAYGALYYKLKNNPDFRDEAKELLEELSDTFGGSLIKIKGTDEEIEKSVENMAIDFSIRLSKYFGISVSPLFFKYSIIRLLVSPTNNQYVLLKENIDKKGFQSEIITELKRIISILSNEENFEGLTEEEIKAEKLRLKSQVDIFSIGNKGMYSRLKELAAANAPFDETIGASVFKDANGNFVYAHQDPTFHSVKINALNDKSRSGEVVNNLKTKLPEFALNNNIAVDNSRKAYTLERNHLLNSKAFEQMSIQNLFKLIKIAGSKESRKLLSDGEDSIMESRDAEGRTYGDAKPGDVLKMLVKLYFANYDPNSGKLKNTVEYRDENDKIVKEAVAPLLIRVLEASNSGDAVGLPVIKAVTSDSTGVKITDQVFDIIIKGIEKEFAKIQTESDNSTAIYNPETGEGNLMIGYNAKAIEDSTGKSETVVYDKNGRAFKFYTWASLLTQLGLKTDISYSESTTFTTSEFIFDKMKSGEIDYLLYEEDVAKKQNFIGKNIVKKTTLKKVKTKSSETYLLKSRGSIKIDKATSEKEKLDFLDRFKAEIDSVKNDDFKYYFKIGDRVYYARTKKIADFFNGDKKFVLYDVITEEETKKEVKETIDYKTKLEEKARNNPKISFEEALKEIGSSKKELIDFLNNRILDEIEQFSYVASELEVSDFGNYIEKGLRDKDGQQTSNTLEAQHYLNITDNRKHNIAQIYINNLLNTKAINEILLGDQSITTKNAIEAVKRAKGNNGAGVDASIDIDVPEYDVKRFDKFHYFSYTEPFGNSGVSENKIKESDGILYLTLKAFRHFWFGFGQLTENQHELLKKIENGEELTSDEIYGALNEEGKKLTAGYAKNQELINSKKLVYFDGETFLKMSAFVLTKKLTSRKVNGEWVPKANAKPLHNLRVKMEKFEEENDSVSIAGPRSNSKMMQLNVSNFIDVFGKTLDAHSFGENNSTVLSAKNMRLQLLKPSNKERIVDASQIKTILTSEQDETKLVWIKIDGVYEEKSIKQIKDAYNNSKKATLDRNYKNKRNLIFHFDIEYALDLLGQSIDENRIHPDLFSYLMYAQNSLKTTGTTTNLLEFFSIDATGNAKYNLNNPKTVQKFEELFMSFFTKSVFNEKVKGDALALAPDTGHGIFRRVYSVDEKGMPDKQEVIRENQFYKNHSESEIVLNILDGDTPGNDSNLEGLRELVEKSNGKGVIIVDRLRFNLKEYNKKSADPSTWEWTNQRYGESVMPALSREIMDMIEKGDKKMQDSFAKMFGVRIPSQDNHSSMNVKLVDFLPVYYGSTAMFAREIVEVSGADFDIDVLYTHMKEHFIRNGEFIEYGDVSYAQNKEFEKYLHYIKYAESQVNKPGTVYNDALLKYKKGKAGNKKFTDKQRIELIKNEGSTDLIQAFSVLGLPITYEEFIAYTAKYGEPYDAVHNNRYLDYKFALAGNRNVTESENGETPISYSPADLEPLKEALNKLAEELEYFLNKKDENIQDPDSLLGQIMSIKNIKEGNASIGKIVLPNLYINLLSEYNVKLTGDAATDFPKFNGVEYKEFGVSREVFNNSTLGQRKQYILSAIITAMTDNAKEMFAYKLGLQQESLGLVAVMVGLGIPLKTTVLFINSPMIHRSFYENYNSTPYNFKKKVGRLKSVLRKAVSENDEESLRLLNTTRTFVNDEFLKRSITENLSVETIAEKYKIGELNLEDVLEYYNLLRQLEVLTRITDHARKINSATQLAKKPGKNFRDLKRLKEDLEELGIGISYSEYKSKKKPFDARIILKESWLGKNIEATLDDLYSKVIPKIFLKESSFYKKVINAVTNNFQKSEEFDLALDNDLLSYLTIKAYLQKLEKVNPIYLEQLNNDVLYKDDVKNIIDTVRDLRNTPQGENNYFLDRFVIVEEKISDLNKTNLNIVRANTFANNSPEKKQEVQSSFMSLYMDPATREQAMSLVHYMMVKDGLQVVYGSLGDALSPVLLTRYLESVDNVQDVLENGSDSAFIDIFGLTKEELYKEFIENYGVAARSKRHIKAFDAFYGIYKSEKAVESIHDKEEYTLKDVRSNPKNLYVFSDNVSREGISGNASVRTRPNTFGFTIKKKLSGKNSFYSEKEIKQYEILIQRQIEELLAKSKNYDKIVFPKNFFNAEDYKAFKRRPLTLALLTKALNDNFDIDITNGGFVSLYRRNIKKNKKLAQYGSYFQQVASKDEKIKNKSLWLNVEEDKVTLILDISKNKNYTVKDGDLLHGYPSSVYTDGLVKGGFEIESIEVNNVKYDEIVTPSFIKLPMASKEYDEEGSADKKYVTFKLKKVRTVNRKRKSVHDLDYNTANYAEYELVSQKGSYNHTAIGFLFGDLVDTEDFLKELQERKNNNNFKNSSFEETDDNTLDYENEGFDDTIDFNPKESKKEIAEAPAYYQGLITELKENELYVFGANDRGLHGQGAAGAAMNRKRSQKDIKLLPDGTKEKWAVKGETGLMEGTEGMSWGIVTVEGELGNKNKENRMDSSKIIANIKEMYSYMEANPEKIAYVAYSNLPSEKSLNGYTGKEMIGLFNAAGPIPSNVVFSEVWYRSNLIDRNNNQEESTEQEESVDFLNDLVDSGSNYDEEMGDAVIMSAAINNKRLQRFWEEKQDQIKAIQDLKISTFEDLAKAADKYSTPGEIIKHLRECYGLS